MDGNAKASSGDESAALWCIHGLAVCRYNGKAAVVRVGSDESGINQVYNEAAVLKHLQENKVPVPAVWQLGSTKRGYVYSVVEFMEVLHCYLNPILAP